MNLSQYKPPILRRFDLQPNIRERTPVVKRYPTVQTLWSLLVMCFFLWYCFKLRSENHIQWQCKRIKVLYITFVMCLVSSGALDWGTAPQAGRSRVPFLVESVEFFIDLSLLAVLWLWCRLSLLQNRLSGNFMVTPCINNTEPFLYYQLMHTIFFYSHITYISFITVTICSHSTDDALHIFYADTVDQTCNF